MFNNLNTNVRDRLVEGNTKIKNCLQCSARRQPDLLGWLEVIAQTYPKAWPPEYVVALAETLDIPQPMASVLMDRLIQLRQVAVRRQTQQDGIRQP
jgi:hypothetical protein